MSNSDSEADRQTISCSEALERIYEFLDGELTPTVEERIREHLAVCRTCFPHFRHEEVFLRFIERRAQIAHAPPALRRKIMQMLVSEEANRALE